MMNITITNSKKYVEPIREVYGDEILLGHLNPEGDDIIFIINNTFQDLEDIQRNEVLEVLYKYAKDLHFKKFGLAYESRLIEIHNL